MTHPNKLKPFFSHPRKIYSSFIWVLASLFVFYKFLMVVTPSVMIKHLTEAFHINATQLGLLAGSYFYSFFLFQIPAGILIDKFGTRLITSIGMTICAAGVLLFSFSQNLFIASLARFIMGIGGTAAILTVLKLSADWFHHKYFAFLNGLMMTFGMFGAIIGQTPFNFAFNIFGWRTTILDIALFGFILALIYWVSVRDRHTLLSFKAQVPTQTISFREGLHLFFKNPQNYLLTLYSGLAWTTITVFAGFWGTPFLKIKYHLGDQPAPFVNSLLFFGFAIGAPFFGWLSDSLKKRKPIMFLGTVATLLFFLVVVYVPAIPTPFLGFFFFLLGFSASTFLLSFPMIYEINPFSVSITALAFMNAGNALLGALADPLVGLFIDVNYPGTDLFSAQHFADSLFRLPFYLATSLILLLFIKETNCKHRYK
ncbi:MAG: MFS transporter [Chlamydiales bacterium]|nr:MFS transporter [Chlamydiales bacterium]